MKTELKEKLKRVMDVLTENGAKQATTTEIKRAIISEVTINTTNVRNYLDLLAAEGYIVPAAQDVWKLKNVPA